MTHPFHLAISVQDLDQAKQFYEEVLGCSRGREDDRWVDFNLYGHQLVCHLSNAVVKQVHNPVDGESVPVPHFGVVLDLGKFEILEARLKSSNQSFTIEPTTRFKGEQGEQRTMFLLDPSNNAIEFKAFANIDNLFIS